MITGIGTPSSHNRIPRPIFTSHKRINAAIQRAKAIPVPEPNIFGNPNRLRSYQTVGSEPPGFPGGSRRNDQLLL